MTPSIAGSSVIAANTVNSTITRGGDADAGEEVQAEHEQAEHRDADRGAGEQHGAAGRVERPDRGLLRRQAGLQAVAVPGDDEQRVVDADAEADQRGEDRADVVDRQPVAQQPDRERAADQREDRADQRQQHREERAERAAAG